MGETRKLAAILVSDVVGYSRLAGADEDRTLARLRALRSDLIDPTISVHHDRIVKRTGDGSVIEFRSVVDAVNCAIEVQRAMVQRNAEVAPERLLKQPVSHRHSSWRCCQADGDLMGDGLHREKGFASRGGVCLSEDAYRQVKSRLELQVADEGDRTSENIAEPVHAYGVSASSRRACGAEVARSRNEPAQRIAALGGARRSARCHSCRRGRLLMTAGLAPRLLGGVAEDKLKTAPRLSIVVLPFANLSGDPDQEHLLDGTTHESHNHRSLHIPDSFVIARDTAFTYKEKPVDAKVIGRELGVRTLLEGSVRRVVHKVEINAQLISMIPAPSLATGSRATKSSASCN